MMLSTYLRRELFKEIKIRKSCFGSGEYIVHCKGHSWMSMLSILVCQSK